MRPNQRFTSFVTHLEKRKVSQLPLSSFLVELEQHLLQCRNRFSTPGGIQEPETGSVTSFVAADSTLDDMSAT